MTLQVTNNYKKYYKERYKNEPEFRKKRIECVTAWAKRNRDKINRTNRKRYANRTPQQIKKRQQQIKKMRTLGRWKRR